MPAGRPFSRPQSGHDTTSALVIDLRHTDDLPVPSQSILARVYDLTPAEALIAQGMARGQSLEEVAAGLNIKITTARTQLASIFAKTGTRRQAKLVVLLSHLAHLERE
jgi:DNA-binding CsgD family transcriptional regulator